MDAIEAKVWFRWVMGDRGNIFKRQLVGTGDVVVFNDVVVGKCGIGVVWMSWVEEHGAGMFGDFACWMVVGEKFEYRMIGITVEFWSGRIVVM